MRIRNYTSNLRNERKKSKENGKKNCSFEFFAVDICVWEKKCYQENIYIWCFYIQKKMFWILIPIVCTTRKRGFTLCYIMLFHIFVFCCFVSSCIYYCKRNVECLNCLLIEKNFLHFYYVFLYTYIFVRFPVVGSFFAYARISIKKKHLANCIYNKYIQSFVY